VGAFTATLAKKVVMAVGAKVRTANRSSAQTAAPTPPLGGGGALDRVLVGLGASTGGTEATLEVMKRLPADSPATVIVQHMPTGFTRIYAERLNRLCPMEVREAKDGDELHRGLALVAPADLQCRVKRAGCKYIVSCQPGEKISGHRPSVDALFQSMEENVIGEMVGIIMTGMGQDGAAGLLAMRQKGAFTIGQDKESCVVYGMPGVAHDIGAVQVQASCENIAGVLLRHLKAL
jgi:two-component system chemotaxis response regulator CheB